MPVKYSTGEYLLEFTDPLVVKRIERGVRSVFRAAIAAFVLMLIIITDPPNPLKVIDLMILALTAYDFTGAWAMTTPRAGWSDMEDRISSRRAVRIAATIVLSSVVLLVILTSVAHMSASNAVIGAIRFLLLFAWLLGWVFRLQFFRAIALRVPNEPLSHWAASICKWLLILGACVLIGVLAFALLPAPPDAYADALMVVMAVSTAVIAVLTILLMARLLTVLMDEVMVARGREMAKTATEAV